MTSSPSPSRTAPSNSARRLRVNGLLSDILGSAHAVQALDHLTGNIELRLDVDHRAPVDDQIIVAALEDRFNRLIELGLECFEHFTISCGLGLVQLTGLGLELACLLAKLQLQLFPDRGGSQSIGIETTIPGSDLSFYKLDYRGQRYLPISPALTLRVHGNLGYAQSFGSTGEVPFYEHYYAGGIGSVRGFRDSSLGPRSTPADVDPDKDQLPFGGNVRITGGAELIFPVPFVTDQRSLRTVLFLDAGNVFDTECTNTVLLNGRPNPGCGDVDLGEIRYSAGVGLSWLTALGPLGFSLGTALNDKSGDDTQFFQFTLGQTF
jgi:hypothetical protein